MGKVRSSSAPASRARSKSKGPTANAKGKATKDKSSRSLSPKKPSTPKGNKANANKRKLASKESPKKKAPKPSPLKKTTPAKKSVAKKTVGPKSKNASKKPLTAKGKPTKPKPVQKKKVLAVKTKPKPKPAKAQVKHVKVVAAKSKSMSQSKQTGKSKASPAKKPTVSTPVKKELMAKVKKTPEKLTKPQVKHTPKTKQPKSPVKASPSARKTKRETPVKKASATKQSTPQKAHEGKKSPHKKTPRQIAKEQSKKITPTKSKARENLSKKIVIPGRGKLPAVRLRKSLSKGSLKRGLRAKVVKTPKTVGAKPPSPSKDTDNVKQSKSPVKSQTADEKEPKASPKKKEVETTKVVTLSDSSSTVKAVPMFPASAQSESGPQIRIDLTGARPSPAAKKQKAPEQPKLSPTKTNTTKNAEKLVKSLSVSPKQAQDILKTLFQKTSQAGRSEGVQYAILDKDEAGNSVLRRVGQFPATSPKKVQMSSRAPQSEPAEADSSHVSVDLSAARLSPVREQVLVAPKTGGVSLDLTTALPSPSKATKKRFAKAAKTGADKAPGQPPKKARKVDAEAYDRTESTVDKEVDPSASEGKETSKKNVSVVKMKSDEAKSDKELQEFLENRKAKKGEMPKSKGQGKKDGKKSNIIVRCSACKNYFEPGKDFTSHKAECLKLHVRCAGCQKYFARGAEYDDHKAQCTASEVPAEVKEQQNDARWEEVIKQTPSAQQMQATTRDHRYKCLVCKEVFQVYKDSREHEEICALVKPGDDVKGVMCSDCKQVFRGRIFLSRHKTQYPGCPAKPPKPLPTETQRYPSVPSKQLQPSKGKTDPTAGDQASLSSMGQPINVQVTFHNGVPKVAVNVGTPDSEEQPDAIGDDKTTQKDKSDDGKEGDAPDKTKKRPNSDESPTKTKKSKVDESVSAEKEDAANKSEEAPTTTEAKKEGVSGEENEDNHAMASTSAAENVSGKKSSAAIEDVTRAKGLTLSDGTPLSKCPLCDKLFKHTEFLKKHFKSFHALDFDMFLGNKEKQQEAIRNARSETLRARFQNKRGCSCLDCGDWFVSRLDLNLHKRNCTKKHSAKLVFPCTLCTDTCFPSRVDLYQHMREKHRDDAELAQTLHFGCHICYSKFSTREALIEHEKQHDEAAMKPGSEHTETKRCLDCGLLVEANMLNQHKEKCVESLVSKPFVCFDCHEQFTSRQDLTEHKRDEHLFSGAPFKCWRCMQDFNFYPDLIQHLMETHRKDKQSAQRMAAGSRRGSAPQAARKVNQQVFKITGDSNLVKLNMFPGKKGGNKSMVLDLSKLKGLIQTEDKGKGTVVTVPAKALAGKEEDMDVELSGKGSKIITVDPVEVKDDAEPATSEGQVASKSGIQQMTAALNLQPKADIKASTTEVKKTLSSRTRSKTGPAPPLPQKMPSARVQPTPRAEVTTRSKSPVAAVQPVVAAAASDSQAATTRSSHRRKHQPAILKRGSSGSSTQDSSSASKSSDSAGHLLQPVGKDQVQCNQCGEVLVTMKAVATHTCLTSPASKQWSMQQVDSEGAGEGVEWFVASS